MLGLTYSLMKTQKISDVDGLKRFLSQNNYDDVVKLPALVTPYFPCTETASREYALLFAYTAASQNQLFGWPEMCILNTTFNNIFTALGSSDEKRLEEASRFDCALFFSLAYSGRHKRYIDYLLRSLCDSEKKIKYTTIFNSIESKKRLSIVCLAQICVDNGWLLTIGIDLVETFFCLRHHFYLLTRMQERIVKSTGKGHEALYAVLVHNWRIYTWCYLKDLQYRCLGKGACRISCFVDLLSDSMKFDPMRLELLPFTIGRIVNGGWVTKWCQQNVKAQSAASLDRLLGGDPIEENLCIRLFADARHFGVGNFLDSFIQKFLASSGYSSYTGTNVSNSREQSTSLVQSTVNTKRNFVDLTNVSADKDNDDSDENDDVIITSIRKRSDFRLAEKRSMSMAATNSGKSAKRGTRLSVEKIPRVLDYALDYFLDVHGFTVLRNVFKSSRLLVDQLFEQVYGRALGVFNHDELTGEDEDHKRFQIPLDATHPVVQAVDDAIRAELKKRFPEHTSEERVVLLSMAGCRVQPVHTDYRIDEKISRCADRSFPCGVLAAVQPDSKLYIWPRSIRLQRLDSSILQLCEPIDAHVIYMKPGDLVVFRGDAFHCGAEYKSDNVRLHYFLDNPQIPREENNTWLLHTENSDPDLIRVINRVAQ